jgi:hypothetical protein
MGRSPAAAIEKTIGRPGRAPKMRGPFRRGAGASGIATAAAAAAL